jgi:hypothetical protein
MIKLTVEIVDDKFKYEYQIGNSRHNSESILRPESLCAFTEILNIALAAGRAEAREWIEEVNAKAYLEKHPEMMVKMKEDIK